MEEKKLKKCPFCGGAAVFKEIRHYAKNCMVGFQFEIECEDCGVKRQKIYKTEFTLTEDGRINPLHDERELAATDWNQRATI